MGEWATTHYSIGLDSDRVRMREREREREASNKWDEAKLERERVRTGPSRVKNGRRGGREKPQLEEAGKDLGDGEGGREADTGENSPKKKS